MFRHFQHALRYRQIARVLARHGFGFLFTQMGIPQVIYRKRPDYQKYSVSERVRLALEELGPTYVKLGQLLSIRPDLIPKSMIKELEKLQDAVYPFSTEAVRQVLLEEGLEIDRVFSHFEEIPMASASIGQVHRARLITGENVVVKIQRPGIIEQVRTDVEILMELARLAESRTTWGKHYQVTDIVKEFVTALTAELDFGKEGRNADSFRKMLAQNPAVKIPEVFFEHSTRRVLVLEYVEGIKISRIDQLKQSGMDLNKIAFNIVDILFTQVYELGFFHADPHPGNLAVTADSQIVFYDFGQIGMMDDILKKQGMDLVLAQYNRDFTGITRSLLHMGFACGGYINRDAFKRDIARMYQRYYYHGSMENINMGEALAAMVQISFRHNVRMPPEMALMVKMLMTMESIVTQLVPDTSLFDIAEPVGRRILHKRYSPRSIFEEAKETADEIFSAVKNIPGRMDNVLEMLEERELTLRMDMPDFKELVNRADRLTNRFSISILVASLIIGTAMFFASLIIGEAFSGHDMSTIILRAVPYAEVVFGLTLALALYLLYGLLSRGRY
ncbi:MAG: ABC1 kinase family protein [Solirubrobacterales bacterium]